MQIITRGQFSEDDIHTFMTEGELLQYDKLKISKREDWLLGRVALKRVAISKLSLEVTESGIEVVSERGGSPSLRLILPNGEMKMLKEIKTALTHSSGVAVADVYEVAKVRGVGLDIEKVRKFDFGTLLSFLHKQEREEFNVFDDSRDADKLATLIWCIKEAYLKARGFGLTMHPGRICIQGNPFLGPVKIFENDLDAGAQVTWTMLPGLYILVRVEY
ncbi:MAG: 4'-phosphopantetheinyl transferase superfamily protein [Candidatus Paceibacterota bacterium]